MLMGKDLGRCHEHCLVAFSDCPQNRRGGDHRFAGADVALEERAGGVAVADALGEQVTDLALAVGEGEGQTLVEELLERASPCSKRAIGSCRARSLRSSVMARICAAVSWKGRASTNVCKKSPRMRIMGASARARSRRFRWTTASWIASNSWNASRSLAISRLAMFCGKCSSLIASASLGYPVSSITSGGSDSGMSVRQRSIALRVRRRTVRPGKPWVSG